MSQPLVAERRKPSDESPHDTTTPDGLRRSARHLSALAAAVLLFGGGIVQGTLSQRWQPATRTNGPETRLNQVPLKIGDWDGEDSAISQAERQMAGVTHDLSRTYTNRRTGEVVNVVLLSGPTGPLAVHPPTACYQGAGYQQTGATRETVIDLAQDGGARHVFAIADFYLPTRPEQSHPRIYWAWSAAGTWSVPESPRLEFSGSRVLFKLYVTCECPLGSQKTNASPIDEFLRLLLVEIQQQVFANPSRSHAPRGNEPPDAPRPEGQSS